MKTTRKLTMAAIMVMVALLAFVGSTFAWMTVANSVTTTEFSGTVQGAEGIYVKLSTSDKWGTEVDLSRVQVKGGGFLKPVCMAPTKSGVTNYTEEADAYSVSKFASLKNLTYSESAPHVGHFEDTTAGYIEFQLDFYSDKATDIALQAISITPAIDSSNVISETTADDAKAAALSCTRVLFSKGASASSSADTTYGYSDTSSVGINTTFTDTHSNNGLPSTVRSTSDPKKGETLYNFYHSSNPSRASFVKAGILSASGTAASETVSIEELPFANYKTTHDKYFVNDNKLKLNTTQNTTQLVNITTAGIRGAQSVTVRVYIEGWDSLCANYIANTKLSISMVFAPIA